MIKQFSKSIYSILALGLVVVAFVTKLFLSDKDFGAATKNYDASFFVSDLLFCCAGVLFLIGLLLFLLQQHKKSLLLSRSITRSGFLIFPLMLILSVAPVLETVFPGEIENKIIATIFGFIVAISTLLAMIWVVYILAIVVKQVTLILISEKEKGD